ncbi:MAG: hypothetical protein WCA85_13450 [Paraburkholderia sp.]|uniref:hypothetical protein n=1 Tax=Paraburkholderia sp. TaxID=1926495 RepID=UPI003C42CB4C
MQISNAASSPTLTQPAQAGTGVASNVTTSNSGTAESSTSRASPSQDAAVNISAEGTAALAGDQGSTAASSTTTQTGTTSGDTTTDTDTDTDTDPDTATATATATADDTNSTNQSDSADDAANDGSVSGGTTSVSPLKSFAYGSLGLERPDQTQQETNSFYTAGRWLAAGITIGGLISLLV